MVRQGKPASAGLNPAAGIIVALSWYTAFKALIFVLLACNAAVFSFTGTFGEALDTAAWLVLLILFELETGHAERLRRKRVVTAVHSIRLAAAAAIGAAAIGYVYEKAWLDAINSGLWIAVVILLEFEIRFFQAVERHRAWFTVVAATLYSGLAALVLAWTWRKAWFEAYDALLWLVAFATLEINVLQIFRKAGAADTPAPRPEAGKADAR